MLLALRTVDVDRACNAHPIAFKDTDHAISKRRLRVDPGHFQRHRIQPASSGDDLRVAHPLAVVQGAAGHAGGACEPMIDADGQAVSRVAVGQLEGQYIGAEIERQLPHAQPILSH